MALDTHVFIAPAGELTEDMFPGDDLWWNLSEWIGEATTRTDREDAQKAWVYYRAYRTVWRRLLINPAEADLDNQGSIRYTREQIDAWRRLSEHSLDEYTGLTSKTTNYAVLRSLR